MAAGEQGSQRVGYGGERQAAALEPVAQRSRSAVQQVGRALARRADVGRQAPQRASLGVEELAPIGGAGQERGAGPLAEARQDRGQLRPVGRGELGRGTRGRRTQVGDEVREGRVRLVAHADDDRARARRPPRARPARR